MKILKNPPLYKKVAASILDRINKKEFPDSVLPSEENLSETTGTSKHTIREALAELASLSYISRRHGHGNVILNSVVDTKFRIDANMNFFKILEQAGYEPEIEYLNLRVENKKFDDCIDEEFIVYDEIIRCGGKVASMHDMNIPKRLFPKDFDTSVDLNNDLFNFLASYGVYSLHSIVEFIPVIPKEDVAELFEISKDTPINTWEEYIYDHEDNLVCITKIRFNPLIFKLKMVRKDFLAV